MKAQALPVILWLCCHGVAGRQPETGRSIVDVQGTAASRNGDGHLHRPRGLRTSERSMDYFDVNEIVEGIRPDAELRIELDTLCWWADFSKSQHLELAALPLKLFMWRNDPRSICMAIECAQKESRPAPLHRLQAESGEMISQTLVPEGLDKMSPPILDQKGGDQAWAFEKNPYRYLSTAGEGITVYVLDLQWDPPKPDDYEHQALLLWRNEGGQPERRLFNHKELTRGPHGPAMAAAITGKFQGVAKRAQIVAVSFGSMSKSERWGWGLGKLIFGKEPDDSIEMIEAIDLIIQDILDRNLQGKAIINLSMAWVGDSRPLDRAFSKATAHGIVIVAAAGNAGAGTRQTHQPVRAGLGTPMIVVGGLDEDSERSSVSQGFCENDIWAPAYGRFRGDEMFGTSLAAARVSGLAAYFMSTVDFSYPWEQHCPIERLAQRVKDYIISTAQRSRRGGPLLASNGMLREQAS